MKESEVISVRLDRKIVEKLDAIGKSLGLDRSNLIRLLLHIGLKDLEFIGVKNEHEES